MAPEVLEFGTYGPPAAAWALGVTMWEGTCDDPPRLPFSLSFHRVGKPTHTRARAHAHANTRARAHI